MSKNVKARQSANLATPTDLGANATKDITGGLNILLADVFALYLKTKNFHWHMSGPHFRDYHLLLDEQADQIYAMTDPIAERVRKLGGNTMRSIGQIKSCSACSTTMPTTSRRSTCWPSCARTTSSSPENMRTLHEVCDEHNDIATASLIENWIDETEQRTWFLFESGGASDPAQARRGAPSPARDPSATARRAASWRRAARRCSRPSTRSTPGWPKAPSPQR